MKTVLVENEQASINYVDGNPSRIRNRKVSVSKKDGEMSLLGIFVLADFEDQHLISELKRRGYTGNLSCSKTVSL